MKQHDADTHCEGETLPGKLCVYRVQVMKAFLRVGVPLSKLQYFRELLEEGAYRLTDTQHMLDMVPFILSQEGEQVKKEIEGRCVLAVVLRFIDGDFQIQ